MPELTPEEEVEIIAEVEADRVAVVEEKATAEALAAERDVAKIAEEEAGAAPAAADNDPANNRPKKTAQERIDEITYRFREAERQADYWKERANEKITVKEKAEPTVVSDRPMLDNFDTTVEYEDALFGWYDNKRESASKAIANEKAVKVKIDTFNKNAKEFKEAHKDFDEVIEAPVFTDTMRNVLFTMDGGPEVTYLIAKNPIVGESFNGLSPEQQIFKIAELRNEVNLTHNTRKITGATGVIEPVGDTGNTDKDPDKMPIDEWMAWNKKRDLAMLEKRMGENK